MPIGDKTFVKNWNHFDLIILPINFIKFSLSKQVKKHIFILFPV